MTRLMIVALLAAALGSAGQAAETLPSAQPPGPHMQPLATPDFIEKLAQSNQFEAEQDRLASTRSASGRVRHAAIEMMRAQRRDTQRTQLAIHRSGLPTPSSPGLDLGQQQRIDQLKAVHGPAFDRLYLEQQVRAQGQRLDLLAGYIQDGSPGPLRSAAIRLRPAVQHRLSVFERLR